MIIYPKYRNKGALHWQDYMDINRASYKNWVDWIVSFFPSGSVLDIGCGDGLFSWLLAENGLDVTGVDVSEDGIKLSRERKDKLDKIPTSCPKFWVMEAEVLANYDIMNLEFDYALATEIIEHIQDYKAIRHIFDKYVKYHMILTTPNGERSNKGRYHVREFTEEELREEFKDYKVERIKEMDGIRISNKIIVLKISK